MKDADTELSIVGYKTIAVAVSRDHGPMEFAGIIPMLDPPRDDTKLTIYRIRHAGVNVKMITGDHLNIARETARLIELGTNIHASTELWPASADRDQMILASDGFAQVCGLPSVICHLFICQQCHFHVSLVCELSSVMASLICELSSVNCHISICELSSLICHLILWIVIRELSSVTY